MKLPSTVFLALLLVGACGGQAAPESQRAPTLATIRTSSSPGPPVYGAGSLWVPNPALGTLSRVDPRTNAVVATIQVGDPRHLTEAGCTADSVHSFMRETFNQRRCDLPSAVAAEDGAIWAAKNDARSLLRIDPATNRAVAEVAVDASPFGIATGPSGVWVTDYLSDEVIRVDRASNSVRARIKVDHGPTGIAVTPEAVWVADSRADTVTRIDPASETVVATIPVGATPLPIVVAGGSVWVRNERQGASNVSRLDPATNRVVGTIPVGEHVGRDGSDGIGIVGSRIWVSGLYLAGIDVRTGKVAAQVKVPGSSVTSGSGSLWLTNLAGGISRVDPPK